MAIERWYPSAADVAPIVERLNTILGRGSSPLTGRVRDSGLLDSALSLPRQTYYRTTVDKAAALFRSLVKNHPFADGNKRIGVLMAILFLERNGYRVTASNGEVQRFTLELAASEPPMTLAEVTRWLRRHSRRLD